MTEPSTESPTDPPGRVTRAAAAVRRSEAYLFMAYALIVFRPGAAPPRHPQALEDEARENHVARVSANWTPEEYQLYIEEARLDTANQQTEKRDIRARAQLMLTTTIVLGGATVASYGGHTAGVGVGAGAEVLYIVASILTVLAGLASGGIISAQSAVGTVNVRDLPAVESGELLRTVADGYAATRAYGAETAATLVTVLRDCVLILILGAGSLAAAHLAG